MEQNYRQSAINWLNGKREFLTGITILQSSGFKPGVVAKLARVGEGGPAAMQRLTFLIREYLSVFGKQVADTDAELHVFDGKESEEDTAPERQQSVLSMAKDSEKYPVPVASLIKRYASAYKERAKAFRLMGDIDGDNSEPTMAERKKLSDQIAAATTEMEKIYPKIQNYIDNQELPEEDEQAEEEAEKAEDAGDEPANPLAGMPVEQLQGKLKALRCKQTRIKNMLEYGQTKAKDAPDPLPESPKRLKYEKQLAEVREELEAVEWAIAKAL